MTAEHPPPILDIDAAAEELELPPASLQALVDAGYLAGRRGEGGRLAFDLADLKAFVARNADNGAGADLLRSFLQSEEHQLEPEELVDLLDQRTEDMALRLLKMFSVVFPDAEQWTPVEQGAFVRRTKERFESVIAVASVGSEVDDGLYDDLREIGASAARSGTQLPELLVLLRMSRDLVVQNAVDLTEGQARHGGFALSLLLTRILPAIDRLSDALAEGYWAEMFP